MATPSNSDLMAQIKHMQRQITTLEERSLKELEFRTQINTGKKICLALFFFFGWLVAILVGVWQQLPNGRQ